LSADTEVKRHLVIFDCNVYLDIASVLGSPFSWRTFGTAVARLVGSPVPHPENRAHDSLRAVAACTSGRFAGEELLEVWTCDHVNRLVEVKANHPTTPHSKTGHIGLGWSATDARDLVSVLVDGLVERSGGGSIGQAFPDGNPPLDHEDGLVYGACRKLSSDDPLSEVYCVTRDRGFLLAHRDKKLSSHTRVINPSTFLALVTASRAQLSIQGMRPRR